MNVNDTTAAAAAQTTNNVPTNKLGRDEFMTLLVAQMSNQNPLEPLEGSDFVAQLATFSNLEQLTGVNEGLDRLSAGQAGLLQGQTIGLVGRTAVFEGNEVELSEDGSVPLHYRLNKPANGVTIDVFDESGKLVDSIPGPAETGMQSVELNAGEAFAPGTYTFAVRANEADSAIDVKTYSTLKIAGITYEDGIPKLIAGSERIDPADILRVLDDAD